MPNGERTGAFCPTLFEQFVAPYPTQSQLLDVCTLGCTLSKIFKKIVKKVILQQIRQKFVIQWHAKLLKQSWTKGSCLLTIRLLPITYFLLQSTLIFSPELSRILGCFSDQLEYLCPIKNLKNFGGFSILNLF